MNSLLIHVHDLCVIWMTLVIWIVQLRIYPHFRSVRASEFRLFHERHCRRITWVVWPMFVELLLCGMILYRFGPQTGWVIQMGGILLTFGATAFLSVPEHNRLGLGKDKRSIERLIRTNWVRTFSWTVMLLELTLRRLA
jgi:hypothetical protein